MSGYQTTGWLAWNHHQALVMMAGLYILEMKLATQEHIPLLSVTDARLLVIAQLFGTEKDVKLCLEHMAKRHLQRQKDIDRWMKLTQKFNLEK